MPSCEVPGVSIARSIQRRAATGRSWICRFETLVETEDAVVSTRGDSPVTVTVSATEAGLSVKSMVAVWSITRTTLGRLSELKDFDSAVRLYVPGGRAGRR